jgi:hypothetical protein
MTTKSEVSECPHCANKFGFAFGTCIECGFNYIDFTFHKIEVWVDELPEDIAAYLVKRHADKTQRIR